jgi:SAM-dependent methyltransferase
MKAGDDYDPEFFLKNNATSSKSAEIIVPLIIDLVSPRSVIDIGCGTGTWLSVFKAHNVDEITGVDGHWVQNEMLLIPKSCFLAHDLTLSLNCERTFDLAVSLEVAEHLDRKYARNFVSTLVQLSSVIVFSAAIPFQDGTHHVNEEWPDYWAKLFGEHEYVPIDCIREKIWNDQDVAWWYAQNILVFAEKKHVLNNPKLQRAFELTRVSQLSIVHPSMHLHSALIQTALSSPGLKEVLGMLPRLMIKAIKRRLKYVHSCYFGGLAGLLHRCSLPKVRHFFRRDDGGNQTCPDRMRS